MALVALVLGRVDMSDVGDFFLLTWSTTVSIISVDSTISLFATFSAVRQILLVYYHCDVVSSLTIQEILYLVMTRS